MMGKVLFMRKGETHTAPSAGILASDLAVGSSVYLMENGSAAEYLVVNQGIPSGSSLYDASCDGTWLLRKDIYVNRQWHSSDVNDYANSAIHSYLNSTFLGLLGSAEQAVIKQVKVPYRAGSGSGITISSGANGLSTKVFLLSLAEASYSLNSNEAPSGEGAELDYFAGCADRAADSKRIAYLDGTAARWWLRSPYVAASGSVVYVYSTGSWDNNTASNQNTGIRPALILPSNALFDKTTLILKGVS